MHNEEQPVTNNSKTGTDLPLLPGGNNGNVGAALASQVVDVGRLFREMVDTLPEPPYEVLDTSAVVDWIKRAAEGVVHRRELEHLLREAERVLWSDWRSVLAAEREHALLARRANELSLRQQGTYWRERDGHRRTTHPAHVVVNRESWDRAKTAAVARRSSIGVVVGELVTTETRRRPPRDWSPAGTGARRRTVRLFARIAVSSDTWAKFRALARRSGVSTERYLGVLVGEAYPSQAR